MSLGPEWKLDVQTAEKERWATSHGWYRGGVGQRKKMSCTATGKGNMFSVSLGLCLWDLINC